jgi:hypothetical protein
VLVLFDDAAIAKREFADHHDDEEDDESADDYAEADENVEAAHVHQGVLEGRKALIVVVQVVGWITGGVLSGWVSQLKVQTEE